MSFRLVYGNASKFKYIAQTLAKISDEGVLSVGMDSLKVWIMSPDKTSMGILDSPSLSFDEFSVEEETRLLIRMDELNKIVKRATRNDEIVMEYKPEEQVVEVVLRDRKSGVDRAFIIPVIPPSPPEMKDISMEATATFTLMADDFKAVIQDVKTVSDVMVFEADEDKVVVSASGEGRDYRWVMREGAPLIDLQVEEPTKSSYSSQAMEVSTKPVGAADNVRVSYATDYPMKIEFTFPNGEKLYLYVAPTLA